MYPGYTGPIFSRFLTGARQALNFTFSPLTSPKLPAQPGSKDSNSSSYYVGPVLLLLRVSCKRCLSVADGTVIKQVLMPSVKCHLTHTHPLALLRIPRSPQGTRTPPTVCPFTVVPSAWSESPHLLSCRFQGSESHRSGAQPHLWIAPGAHSSSVHFPPKVLLPGISRAWVVGFAEGSSQ